MTDSPTPDAAKVTPLTDEEREVIGWWDDGRYGCLHTERVCPTPDECREKYGLLAVVESFMARAWREGCLAVCNGGIDECGHSEPHMHPERNPYRELDPPDRSNA